MRKLPAKNAMRSGLVVIGAVAFGYLSLELGFKPYLEKAQQLHNLNNQLPDRTSRPDDEHHHHFDNAAVILDDGSGSGGGGS